MARITTTHQFLQETEASIVLTDLRGFTALTHQLGPVDLGLALSSYYNHVGNIIEKNGGRIVKFVGDGVLACFVATADHRGKALAAVAEMAERREAWLADNAKVSLPILDYTAAAASGEVLCGELGTDRIRFWDVLGAPVNLAGRLCGLAADRKVANLVDSDTFEKATHRPTAAVEVDPAELGGKRHRLFRLGE
jgi:adenylate cyclase